MRNEDTIKEIKFMLEDNRKFNWGKLIEGMLLAIWWLGLLLLAFKLHLLD